jgi:hypothetical protein
MTNKGQEDEAEEAGGQGREKERRARRRAPGKVSSPELVSLFLRLKNLILRHLPRRRRDDGERGAGGRGEEAGGHEDVRGR